MRMAATARPGRDDGDTGEGSRGRGRPQSAGHPDRRLVASMALLGGQTVQAPGQRFQGGRPGGFQGGRPSGPAANAAHVTSAAPEATSDDPPDRCRRCPDPLVNGGGPMRPMGGRPGPGGPPAARPLVGVRSRRAVTMRPAPTRSVQCCASGRPDRRYLVLMTTSGGGASTVPPDW